LWYSDEDKVVEIHLIRHGKTSANEERLYCGQTDLPLSENGVAEIALLKSNGIYPLNAGMFFTSGMLRSEQTLDIIYGKIDRSSVPGIAEFKFGLFEMKSHDELKNREDYQVWITDETGDAECPGGESKNSFVRRVIEGYSYILNIAQRSGSVSAFVSCHGGVIACIMELLQPKIANFHEWLPEPGHGYSLTYVSGRFSNYKSI
jgi:alpha-ribazole phosphatase